ncbi:MAG: hypothetical protein IT370_22845 [Deltaproteobacteria bacterium]|nr:hypothetical protein [Deltaproteobacteria bacterium]
MAASTTSTALVSAPAGIAELLAQHPLPREMIGQRRLEWLWTVDVDATPDQLWPLLADLSRLNRALGLPPMKFEERDGERWGRGRYAGIAHEWLEVPWNWVKGHWYELTRLYRRGGMKALYGVVHLTPLGAQRTRVQVYYTVVPRSRIFDLGLLWNFAAMGRAYKRVVPQLAAEAQAGPLVPATLQHKAPELRPEASERLTRLGRGLVDAGLDAAAVARVVDWVRSADDVELERMRVRERAQVWELDEDKLLKVCLHATRAGLLELTWDVICPHCRGVRDSTQSLGALPSRGQCGACGIDFGTDSPDAVEIAFHAHSSIRSVAHNVYCSAEPAHKPHLHIQRTVAPGETVVVPLPEAAGRYRLRLRGDMRYAWAELRASAPEVEVEIEIDWRASAEPHDVTAAPGARLRLYNDGSEARTFIVETAAWLDLALRPGRLLSFQDFRDLFSEEYLGSDVQLAVGEQTILFTDVVGSTVMYAQRGDPAAFVEVKRHFEELFKLIAEHRGAVVKTIGDAAMGAFNDPLDAVRAARAIHAAFAPGHAMRLRISIHTGPCIAVRLNANIDYFGHAVNLAAKLQAAAESWQIALSEATLAAPGVAEYLAREQAALEDVSVPLKGLATPVLGKRWTVATAPAR